MRNVVLLLGLVTTFAVACGKEKEKKEAAKPCPAAPAAAAQEPDLPAGFPKPAEVTYTGSEQAGPSTKVSGYWDGDVDAAFEGYKDAFSSAGYDVTKDEHEEVDAEVNFKHGDLNGEVKLLQTCADRTSVTITARPE